MSPEQAAALRGPFPSEVVGKLPRVWCAACRDSRTRSCEQHQRRRCPDCGNNITSAHVHLDYVGHAQVTDRLLAVDPGWVWEPVAFDDAGLPAVDRHGGLWIRLTVAGVTRYGYGHADGKSGPDAVKEAIGDALRNAAMRFGVGLDLWGATPVNGDPAGPGTDAQPERQRAEQAVVDKATAAGFTTQRLHADLADRHASTAATVAELLTELTDDQLRDEWRYFHNLAAHRAETAGQVDDG